MILKNLPKFENDPKLVRRFNALYLEWQRAYDKINIPHQISEAHAWLITSGKQYKDMARFLNNWLRTAQRWALESKVPLVVHPKYKEDKPKEDDVMSGEDFKRMREALRK